MKPRYFKIKETRTNNTNNGIVYYILQYDAKLFTGALCASIGPEMYYPQTTTLDAEDKMAVQLCLNCNIKEACLEWALIHERDGIWGGMTPKGRKRERRRRRWGLTEPRTTLAVVNRANP